MLSANRKSLVAWTPLSVGFALLGCLTGASAYTAVGEPAVVAVDGLGETQSFDLVVERGVIHGLLAGRFGKRDRLAYLYSTDGGKTWSEPTFLDEEDEAPVISRRGNDVRLAVHDRQMVAVWQHKGELPGTGPLAVAASADGGRTWRRGRNPAVGDPFNNQSYPAIAASDDGRFHLVWLDDREESGNTQGLRYATSSDGLQWTGQTTLDPSVCTCCWTRISALPDRSVAVLYRDADPHDMRLLRGPVADGKWLDLGPIGVAGWHFTGCPHCGGGLVAPGTDEKTVLHAVAWTGKEASAGLFYARSTDLGKHWESPFFLGDGRSRESDIAARSASDLAIVFSRASADGAAVYFVRTRDGGRHWSVPVALTKPDASADHPRIVATPWGYRVFLTMARPGGGKILAMAHPSS